MKTKPQIVPDSLIIAIIIHTLIGWGYLYLVKTALTHLNYNCYLGLIPAVIIISPFLLIVYDLACIFPNKAISEIFMLIFGKIVGKLIAINFLFYLLLFLTLALRDAQTMVYTYFFDRTPFFLFTAVVLIASLYLGLKGVHSIGRLAAFMLLPPLALLLLMTLLGLSNVNLNNIQPMLGGSAFKWLQAGSNLTLVLLPVLAIIYYLPFIEQPKTVKKIGFISLGVVVPLFFLALFGAIGVFGPSPAKKMVWPIVEFFHILDYPYLLLEQAGLFFLIAWYPFVFIGMTHGLFVIGNESRFIFPQIKRNWYTLAAAILIFIGANLHVNPICLQNFLSRFQELISLSFLAIILITWLAARWRFRK